MTTDATAPAADDASHFLFERYKDEGGLSPALRAYYAVRPLIPRGVQIAVRRRYARRQAQQGFPRWPVEPILVERLHAEFRDRLADHGERGVPFVNPWPRGARFAFVLTHDVESEAGVENVAAVQEVEARHGFVSSWNFCAEEYPIRDGVFEALRSAGCEIGLHGVDHQGKYFGTRERFEAALPKIHSYMAEWGAVGFRSPALHRNADWMPELRCEYDSSYPDTDPFQPQAGGCCSIFPFFNRDLVELPVTLAQDHTVFDILERPDIRLWTDKSDWVREHHGLVNVIVHPDYMLTPERLAHYDAFLAYLSRFDDGWHALPRDVARWWRRRERLRVEPSGDGHVVAGDDAADATVAYARESGGRIVFDV